MNFSKVFKQAMVAVLSFAIADGPALAARTTTYFHTDAAGSVVAMTNEAGVVLGRKDYAPFGEQIQTTPDAERTSYTGKQHDDVIGLTYFGARWFDPEIGRFTGVDPVSFVDQQPMSFNRYLYAFDNPYKYVDPDGQWAILLAAAAILVGLMASDAANAPTGTSVDIPQGDATKFAITTWTGSSTLARRALVRKPVRQTRSDPRALVSRQGPDEMSSSKVQKLRKSMRKNGYDESQPIDVADVKGQRIIIDGHHRAEAAARTRIRDVPINVHSVSKERGSQLLREVTDARAKRLQGQ